MFEGKQRIYCIRINWRPRPGSHRCLYRRLGISSCCFQGTLQLLDSSPSPKLLCFLNNTSFLRSKCLRWLKSLHLLVIHVVGRWGFLLVYWTYFLKKRSFLLLLLFFHSAVASQCSTLTPHLQYILSPSWVLFKLKITGEEDLLQS